MQFRCLACRVYLARYPNTETACMWNCTYTDPSRKPTRNKNCRSKLATSGRRIGIGDRGGGGRERGRRELMSRRAHEQWSRYTDAPARVRVRSRSWIARITSEIRTCDLPSHERMRTHRRVTHQARSLASLAALTHQLTNRRASSRGRLRLRPRSSSSSRAPPSPSYRALQSSA